VLQPSRPNLKTTTKNNNNNNKETGTIQITSRYLSSNHDNNLKKR
jgi:hypothetical protein